MNAVTITNPSNKPTTTGNADPGWRNGGVGSAADHARALDRRAADGRVRRGSATGGSGGVPSAGQPEDLDSWGNGGQGELGEKEGGREARRRGLQGRRTRAAGEGGSRDEESYRREGGVCVCGGDLDFCEWKKTNQPKPIYFKNQR